MPLRRIKIGPKRWLPGVVALLLVGLFAGSYLLDGIVRSRTEAAINARLKGYHAVLPYAHLQLLGGTLTLRGLAIVQLAHPTPPVLRLPMMRFQIEWLELFDGKIVADLLLWHPELDLVKPQLVAEERNPVPIKQQGWQDAIEAVYPFKINRVRIVQGDITYVEDERSAPLHLEKLNLTTANIRNIRAPNAVYPSTIDASAVVFGSGYSAIKGRANYLEKPFPGIKVRYVVREIPLKPVTPALRWTKIAFDGGRLASDGLLEYSPRGINVDVNTATIDHVKVTYLHDRSTSEIEAAHVKRVGEGVERANNNPAAEFLIRRFDVVESDFIVIDRATDPEYRLTLDQANLTIANLSNREAQGRSELSLDGRFMGSGDTRLAGWFLAAAAGPTFNVSLAINDTNLPSLNDLLRAYGRFEVAAGQFSLYSQMAVQNDNLTGYVKPLFSNVEVYSHQKEQGTGVLHQAKEVGIGVLAHVFRNQNTQKVATKVNLSGKLSQPNVSTWQSVVEVLRNAFVQAILPGFDRAAGASSASAAPSTVPRSAR